MCRVLRLSLNMLLVALPMSGLFIGCGSESDRTRLWGKVTYNGQSVNHGMIEFVPDDKTAGPSTGTLIHDGLYDLAAQRGPFVNGSYIVRMTGTRDTGKTVTHRDDPKSVVKVVENYIPTNYNVHSTLKITVLPDFSKKSCNFDLPGEALRTTN